MGNANLPRTPEDRNPNEIHGRRHGSTRAVELLDRIAVSLENLERRGERLERRLDEFARVYLSARFPYGKPTDRWGRGGRGVA